MNDLEFFDVHGSLGLAMNGTLETVPDAAALLREMDRVGVARAVVAHLNAPAIGTVRANAELWEMLQADASGRLFGCYGMLPGSCDEIPVGADWLAMLKAQRAVMLELLPLSHRFPVRRETVGEQMELLAEHRVPIKVSVTEFTWNGIYDLLERFPANRFIIAKLGLWGSDRNVRPLLENYENVFFELSEYWVADGLTAMVAKYGASQLLFGSGYPIWTHAQQMFNVHGAAISETAQKQIASGNLERLISEVRL